MPETFVLDCLAFQRPEQREFIRETLGKKVFSNQNIMKILHGCISSDVTWLIRDFGILLTSVFDTHEFERHFIGQKDLSLASLWKKHCEGLVDISKDQKGEF